MLVLAHPSIADAMVLFCFYHSASHGSHCSFGGRHFIHTTVPAPGLAFLCSTGSRCPPFTSLFYSSYTSVGYHILHASHLPGCLKLGTPVSWLFHDTVSSRARDPYSPSHLGWAIFTQLASFSNTPFFLSHRSFSFVGWHLTPTTSPLLTHSTLSSCRPPSSRFPASPEGFLGCPTHIFPTHPIFLSPACPHSCGTLHVRHFCPFAFLTTWPLHVTIAPCRPF